MDLTDNKSHVLTVEKRIRRFLEKHGISSLLVAVSGGADSVALLTACANIATRTQLRIEAVNCNFHLRGEESNRDSEFVASLCRHLGVTLHTRHYDVATYMDKHTGISTEMACRELRYSDFFRIATTRGLDRVAVAHNADDDIETMFLNMLRGCGSRGLKGMDSDNGKVIRPLLSTTRKEIECYLAASGQEFMTDSTNLTNEYRRNYLRHEIIPLLENRWQGARKALSRTVEIMKEESAIIENHYRHQIDKYADTEQRKLNVYATGIMTGTIRRFIEPYGGNPAIAKEITDALGKPFARRTWQLDLSHSATLERDCLVITDLNKSCVDPSLKWSCIEMSECTMKEVKQNSNHKIIYLPQSKSAYLMREPHTGDRIAPLGMKGTRLVSDVMSDAHLDSCARSQVRVLVRRSDGEIIWIPGFKRSRHELITPETQIIHKAEFIPPYNSEH